MARTYCLGFWRKGANLLIRSFLWIGLGPPRTYLLAVRGRKTGQIHSTPVTLVEKNGMRWLVSPYGEVSWVKNARAAGQVTLVRARTSETVTISELRPEEAAPVLKEYITRLPITRPFFDVIPKSPLEDFVAEAPRHPVFLLLKTPPS